MNKWYVIKLSEENKKKYNEINNFVICKYYEGLEKRISSYDDTTVLVTTSIEIAENTKKALDEQLREQGN